MTANFAAVEYDMKSKSPPASQDEMLLKSCWPVSDDQTYFPNLMYQGFPSIPKYYAPDEHLPEGGKCGTFMDANQARTSLNNAFTIPEGSGAEGLFG